MNEEQFFPEPTEEDKRWFRNLIIGALIGASVLLGLCWVWASPAAAQECISPATIIEQADSLGAKPLASLQGPSAAKFVSETGGPGEATDSIMVFDMDDGSAIVVVFNADQCAIGKARFPVAPVKGLIEQITGRAS